MFLGPPTYTAIGIRADQKSKRNAVTVVIDDEDDMRVVMEKLCVLIFIGHGYPHTSIPSTVYIKFCLWSDACRLITST
ncbi:hypothetical protein RRF57_005203 [Xylaria bambusicola]|uniref:Uncharacterized protein n=1 Tax=Xylaria bambusicola TaxID=326684 RepID=A0AAN7UHJ1_9PEZI